MLGDGGTSFAPSGTAPVPIDSAIDLATEGGEVMGAQLVGKDIVTSEIGPQHSGRSSSIIRRRSGAGDVTWTLKDKRVGAGSLMTLGHNLAMTGYVSPRDMVMVPVLKGVNPEGRELWQRELSLYPSSTWVGFARWGEAKGIGVVAPFLSEGERSELGLAVFDSDGHMTSEGRITLPEGVRGSNAYTGAVAVSGESALLLVSKRRAPNASNKIKGALGLERFCWDGGATFAYLVDLKTLAVRASNAIGNVSLSRIVVDGDGFLVAGTRPLACDLGDRGFIGKLDAALLLTGLWTDDGPFKSAVSGILRTPDGIKGVGSIERTLGVREIKPGAAVPDARDVASVRAIVSNRYARSEAFVVEVKTDGQAMRQTSSSGLRLVPFGIIDSGSPRFVYGSASFFPWWGWMH